MESVIERLSRYDDSTLERAEAAARAKLERIIEREGDADGARRAPWYLYCLIDEYLAQEELSVYCGQFRRKEGIDHEAVQAYT